MSENPTTYSWQTAIVFKSNSMPAWLKVTY